MDETVLAFINPVSEDDLMCIGRPSKDYKHKYETNHTNEEASKQRVFWKHINIGTFEYDLSIIKWICQASIQSLNWEQVTQETKTIVQYCSNQCLFYVSEYRLGHLLKNPQNMSP